jgi:hypothetical protein
MIVDNLKYDLFFQILIELLVKKQKRKRLDQPRANKTLALDLDAVRLSTVQEFYKFLAIKKHLHKCVMPSYALG